jgi:hypothetical protein
VAVRLPQPRHGAPRKSNFRYRYSSFSAVLGGVYYPSGIVENILFFEKKKKKRQLN